MIFNEISPNLTDNTQILNQFGNIKIPKILKSISQVERDQIYAEIVLYYFEKQWGIKLLARNVLGVSYTKCRSIFVFFGLQYRTGRNVVTESARQFRKQKSIEENRNNVGFNSPEVSRFGNTTHRGVQGYYLNQSTNEYVWLRSTYEYIFAKFLDKIHAKWKTEQSVHLLSDGTRYRPDFYIYNDLWELQQIVEIKWFWDNRAYKPELLKSEFFSETNVDVILIKDISQYIQNDLTYEKELKEWKIVKISKEQKSSRCV